MRNRMTNPFAVSPFGTDWIDKQTYPFLNE